MVQCSSGVQNGVSVWKFKFGQNMLSSIGQTISVVNKGRHVTLKYFILLRKIIKEHRLFTEVLKKHKFNLDWYEIR